MARIQITDNSSRSITDCSRLDIDNLSKIANTPIMQLSVNNNSNLLIFPQDLNRYGDDIGESNIIAINKDKILTGNILGFVGINDTQLDITSRFAGKDCKQDFFLHYMLQRVFSINLFDIQHNVSREPVFDFLLYLFPYYLKKALAQGLFKKYRRYEYNDANIRGSVDVSRHIRKNEPFNGAVAYSTREHSYDNEVTQLVRHTIEYIRATEMGSSILNNDVDTKNYVSQIIMATQSYNVRERSKIINQNLRPIRHPYYSFYTDLQKICLQILRHESIKYGQEKDKVYGILFDGAWLWEEYLNTIFVRHNIGIIHAKNKTGENGIALYKNGKKCYYPDFYKINGTPLVLDAKYKRLNNERIDECTNYISICRDDLFQMITYMHILQSQHCALLYPLEPDEKNHNNPYFLKAQSRFLNGYGGQISGYGISIPKEVDIKDFWDKMNKMEGEFAKEISKLTKS